MTRRLISFYTNSIIPTVTLFPQLTKKTVVIVLPYLGYLSIITRRKITGLVSKYYPTADFKVIFKSGYSIRKIFCYKDKVPKKCLSGVVHYYTHCEKCGPSKAYTGKTKNTLYEQFHSSNGHLHPSSKKSALLEHLHKTSALLANLSLKIFSIYTT